MGGASLGDKKPNLVYVLMDDTDVLLGSADRMLKQAQALIADKGAKFTHFRTHSPKCTPSRTGQLVGRFYQNVRPNEVGPGLNQTTMFEPDALFPTLFNNGYLTSITGKVHNGQAGFLCKEGKNNTQFFSHIKTHCSPCGAYWKDEIVVKDLGSTAWRKEELDMNDWSSYSHAVYSNATTKFIKDAVAADKPFFAYVGTTGPHLPSIPAPWHEPYINAWDNKSAMAPRSEVFNAEMKTHHPTIAALPEITADGIEYVDRHHRDRLGVLWSVDDLIAEVVKTLEETGVLDNTYIIISSDHGYHLGQYRLPMEKMWPYETDCRIPFYIRGPGIDAGQVLDVMGVNVDIMPTLLDAAGIAIPDTCDGKSLLPLITSSEDEREKARSNWRTRTVTAFAEGNFQYWGHTSFYAPSPDGDFKNTVNPPSTSPGNVTYTYDNPQNQWRALRVSNATDNFVFVEWDPAFKFETIAFTAYFDIDQDPMEQTNTLDSLSSDKVAALRAELREIFSCTGKSCP